MENTTNRVSPEQGVPEELPSLIKHIKTQAVAGFDNVEFVGNTSDPSVRSDEPNRSVDKGTEGEKQPPPSINTSMRRHEAHHSRSISISMPSSPTGLHIEGTKRVMFTNEPFSNGKSNLSADPSGVGLQLQLQLQQPNNQKFHSQPMPMGDRKNPTIQYNQHRNYGHEEPRDKRFDPFKTWSGRLERQLSNLRGKPQEPEPEENNNTTNNDAEAVPVDRYFDALEGPELDTLKATEVSVLPQDKKWPFLLRFPISSFGICLGVSSQAILWKTLATSPSTQFLHVSLKVNLILWCVALALMLLVSSVYFLKVIFYFEAIKREYYHPVRVNFFFAPWIACLFLALGVPPSISVNPHAPLWYVLMAPILCLELKLYGQWMSGGQRRLSKVANPSNHLSIVGNFVGALLGASMGLKEGPIFFFAVGLAHYTVLFVTLYQRLPTNETLPKELHPVFFLFVAAPSVACTAWAKIRGDFDYGSRIAFFISLFLYFSLAVRVNFFRGFRFSLAWWAYTFPMTGASIATIQYAAEVRNPLTQALSVALSAISTMTVTALLISTMIHAFVLRDLFPNDNSIAISERRAKPGRKRAHLWTSGSIDTMDLEAAITVNILGHQLSL